MSPFSPGVSIQWEATAYTVSEGIEVVELVLLKVGLSSYNLPVILTTQDSSARGMYLHMIGASMSEPPFDDVISFHD